MVFDNLDGLKNICDEAKIHSDISVQVNKEQVFNICFYLIQMLCKDPEYLGLSKEAFKAKQIIIILREMSDKTGENWVCHKIVKIQTLVLKSEEDFNKGTTKPNLDIKPEEDFTKTANWYVLQRQVWDQCSPYWSEEKKNEFMKKIGLEEMPFPSN
jgi:hypothetical protein